jgi:hypothetical protein
MWRLLANVVAVAVRLLAVSRGADHSSHRHPGALHGGAGHWAVSHCIPGRQDRWDAGGLCSVCHYRFLCSAVCFHV